MWITPLVFFFLLQYPVKIVNAARVSLDRNARFFHTVYWKVPITNVTISTLNNNSRWYINIPNYDSFNHYHIISSLKTKEYTCIRTTLDNFDLTCFIAILCSSNNGSICLLGATEQLPISHSFFPSTALFFCSFKYEYAFYIGKSEEQKDICNIFCFLLYILRAVLHLLRINKHVTGYTTKNRGGSRDQSWEGGGWTLVIVFRMKNRKLYIQKASKMEQIIYN